MGVRAHRRTRCTTLAFAALVAAMATMTSRSGYTAAGAVQDQLTPVLASVLAKPAAVVQSDGVWRLPYEIELTNVSDVPLAIESVEARDPDRDGAAVASLGAEQVATS